MVDRVYPSVSSVNFLFKIFPAALPLCGFLTGFPPLDFYWHLTWALSSLIINWFVATVIFSDFDRRRGRPLYIVNIGMSYTFGKLLKLTFQCKEVRSCVFEYLLPASLFHPLRKGVFYCCYISELMYCFRRSNFSIPYMCPKIVLFPLCLGHKYSVILYDRSRGWSGNRKCGL